MPLFVVQVLQLLDQSGTQMGQRKGHFLTQTNPYLKYSYKVNIILQKLIHSFYLSATLSPLASEMFPGLYWRIPLYKFITNLHVNTFSLLFISWDIHFPAPSKLGTTVTLRLPKNSTPIKQKGRLKETAAKTQNKTIIRNKNTSAWQHFHTISNN